MESSSRTVWRHWLLGLLRIAVGFLFIAHGTQKVFDFPPSGKPPMPLEGIMFAAGYVELIGGAMFLLGILTRPVAFILAGEMAVAYFKAHAPRAFWPITNKGELAVALCFLFLYFVAAGAGALSIDSLFRRDKDRNLVEDEIRPGAASSADAL